MRVEIEETNYEIWQTKNGKEIPIKEMTTRHIKNCLKLLHKNGFVSAKTQKFYLSCSEPSGEMAQDAFQRELDYWISHEGNEYIDKFVEELKNRGKLNND